MPRPGTQQAAHVMLGQPPRSGHTPAHVAQSASRRAPRLLLASRQDEFTPSMEVHRGQRREGMACACVLNRVRP